MRQLHASKIRLLVQLDQTLRLLGVNLLAANLYTEDLDEDVLLRLELCKTTMLRERARDGIGASWYDADVSLQVTKVGSRESLSAVRPWTRLLVCDGRRTAYSSAASPGAGRCMCGSWPSSRPFNRAF
jgi:hypothetical protein